MTVGPLSEPLGLRFYRAASWAAAPVARLMLARRLGEGKEDGARLSERMGETSVARPSGPLCWIHGASVGESLSILPLVDRLRGDDPALNVLVTTGTTTSAKLMAARLPAGVVHQFIPVDHPRFVRGFLDHWRPDAAVFVESDFWPNLLVETRRRADFMALVNGRISPRSFEGWSRNPRSIRYLLSQFDVLVAQDRQNAERLSALAGRTAPSFGNLKLAAPPLPGDAAAEARLLADLGGRPCWIAASTHPGEDAAILAAHKTLRSRAPRLVTMIAPRHPERGDAIAGAAAADGLKARRRSASDAIDPDTDIYVADTLGELGVFYRLCRVAFIGGSLVEKGGHNPLEPARLGAAILHGPHIFNFAETYADLRAAGGAGLVRNDRELAAATGRLIADETTRKAMADAAKAAAETKAAAVLDGVVGALGLKSRSRVGAS